MPNPPTMSDIAGLVESLDDVLATEDLSGRVRFLLRQAAAILSAVTPPPQGSQEEKAPS